ncbi:MAG: bifunctional glycosyltransferase family 2/GtrA family protein [Micropruina sp.]|nr:MAG: bifunctional glycosyltransferase family 2/GtrA family protein [Micropruina sp.]
MIVLIPAYEPDHKLIGLLRTIRDDAPSVTVVVVDDGSGPRYASIFAEAALLGADVIGYATNRGKGSALKFGFAHIAAHHPGEDVVCADSDGQHQLLDILRVGQRVESGTMVLGVRTFDAPAVGTDAPVRVPLRSRLGNQVTAGVFGLLTGHRLRDTQTGLRGYPAAMLPWLQTVPGARFEYELNLLLQVRAGGFGIAQVPITTIYLEDNASSHFRPLVDSFRVYLPLLRYAASSFGAFAIDFVALLVIQALTGSLLAAVIAARGISSAFNFLTNRHVVFAESKGRPLAGALVRYYTLVAVMLLANYGLLTTLVGVGLPLVVAKVAVEVTLFFAGYQVQRDLVFAERVGAPQLPQAGSSRTASAARA